MILGILSDTHGHIERTRVAAEILQSHNPDVVIHCGDVGSAGVLVELASIFEPNSIPVHVVLGNVDIYNSSVEDFPSTTCIQMHGRTASIQLGDVRVAIVHGDDPLLLRTAISQQVHDYVFTGHTHEPSDRREGKSRIINPGAVYRAAVPSVGILDTNEDLLRYIPLDRAERK